MNQRRALIWVSLGAPLLVLLALLATNQRFTPSIRRIFNLLN